MPRDSASIFKINGKGIASQASSWREIHGDASSAELFDFPANDCLVHAGTASGRIQPGVPETVLGKRVISL